ncbi:hypothetical protein OIO90_001093 [Microbotryomycetes sp. JL221]|nr:hypothetical protein OIO90_001093 [Microbotryomycetes sp. JL221]
MLYTPFKAMLDMLDPVPTVSIRPVKSSAKSVTNDSDMTSSRDSTTVPRRQRQRAAARPQRRRLSTTSITTSSSCNSLSDDDRVDVTAAMSWTTKSTRQQHGVAIRRAPAATKSPCAHASCWLEVGQSDDNDDQDGLTNDCSPSHSPVPSLSPSRPRLFPDDSDMDVDDDEDEDDDNESDEFEVETPNSGPSPSREPHRQWTAGVRTVVRKPLSFDPLLSPPPQTPVLAPLRTRRGSAGWLPAGSSVPSPAIVAAPSSSSVSNTLANSPVNLATGAPASTASKTRANTASLGGGVSLLTKSLRSLARLPNLSLLPSTTPSSHLVGLDLDDAGPIDDEWRSSSSSSSTIAHQLHSPRGLSTDHVIIVSDVASRVTSVQLKTFTAPLATSTGELSTPNGTTTSPKAKLDVPVGVVVSGDELTNPQAPSVTLPILPPPRLISNQRHLLMLALEINMMQNNKIRSPLRPRAVIVRRDSLGHGALSARNVMSIPAGSALRWEVKV